MKTQSPIPAHATDFSPYGDLISLENLKDSGVSANQGSALRINHVTNFVNLRPDSAKANVAVFQCEPRSLPFEVCLLEKHPLSTQIFIPMNAKRYFVIVAHGEEKPDFGTMKIFMLTGTDAISYKPGVWHHPMIAVTTPIDFVCFVHEDDTSEDCIEYFFTEEEKFLLNF